MREIITTAIVTEQKLPHIAKSMDDIGNCKVFTEIDYLKEHLHEQVYDVIILDETFVSKSNISQIKTITLGKSKIIGVVNYDNIHKTLLGMDNFILTPLDTKVLVHKVRIVANTIGEDITPNHFFDNHIIFECISKFNRIQMHLSCFHNLDMGISQSAVDFLMKNIEWNLRLLEVFHVSIQINIPYFQMLIQITEDLMKLFSTKIKIHINDDITALDGKLLQEIIVKTICLCRFATKYEKVYVKIQHNKIFTNVAKKFSNTFSSRLLKFALEYFNNIPVIFEHKDQ